MVIPTDKALHFIVGVLIFTALHFANHYLAIGAVVFAALGKEVYDLYHRDKHTPEWMDAVATITGGLIAWLNTY